MGARSHANSDPLASSPRPAIGGQDMGETVRDTINRSIKELNEGHVTILRGQHEALMAAAKALSIIQGRELPDWEIQDKALAALRAAGIRLEGTAWTRGGSRPHSRAPRP